MFEEETGGSMALLGVREHHIGSILDLLWRAEMEKQSALLHTDTGKPRCYRTRK